MTHASASRMPMGSVNKSHIGLLTFLESEAKKERKTFPQYDSVLGKRFGRNV